MKSFPLFFALAAIMTLAVIAHDVRSQENAPDPLTEALLQHQGQIDALTQSLEKTLGKGYAVEVAVTAKPVEVTPATPQQVIDFTNGDQLAGVPGVIDGTVQYHLQHPGGDYAKERLLKSIAETPDGGHLLWDTEPWLHSKEANYFDNGEADNLALFRAYADTIWHFGPELRKRDITLYVYQAPVILKGHFTTVRREQSHPHFKHWRAMQEQRLWQAEHSGFLPALRAAGGKVAIAVYIPSTWSDGDRWAANAGRMIDNLGEVLDAGNCPHVYMIRPDCAGKPLTPLMFKTLVDRSGDRLAVWGTEGMTGYPELRALLGGTR